MLASVATALALSVLAAGPDDSAQTVKLKLVPTGMSKVAGYYAPQRVTLSTKKPDSIKKLPEGLEAPLFGKIAIVGRDGAAYHIVLDEPDGKPARLFIDTNGNGDLTDDPATEWRGREQKNDEGDSFTQYSGGGMLSLGADKSRDVHLSMYRFDKNDPKHAAQKNLILYYRDYGAEGEMTLGGKTYAVRLLDDNATGDFRGKELEAENPRSSSGVRLLIDVNGDGKFARQGESFDARRPFNIAGTTYELADMSADGTSFKIRKSNKQVDEVALAPEHAVGNLATKFEAKTMDGKPVKFPGDYKGKVVLLDFWATWCGPCMKEMPNVAAAYQKYHDQGFEILGVSFDKENAEEKIKKVQDDKHMAWAQVYEGKGWETKIGTLYAIHGIPAAYLVDGDTGKILAADVRGKALDKAIEEALKKKHEKS